MQVFLFSKFETEDFGRKKKCNNIIDLGYYNMSKTSQWNFFRYVTPPLPSVTNQTALLTKAKVCELIWISHEHYCGGIPLGILRCCTGELILDF